MKKTIERKFVCLFLCIAMLVSNITMLTGCFDWNKPDNDPPTNDPITPPVDDPITPPVDDPGNEEGGSEGMVILPVNTDWGKDVPFGTLSEATIWGAPATEKVLMNVHGIYDDIVTDAEVVVNAAKGEYEAQQIIITAGENRLRYTVELSALTNADGDVFPVENIDLFHEGYVEVTKLWDNYATTPVGWYPDALIPYEGVVATGENLVEPHCNQGLYFRFNVPIDQPHGVYEGSATLTIGGESQIIPITLNVMNVTVSEESHAKSIFLTRWQYYAGELDSSQEMHEKYIDALLEYRLNPSVLLIDNAHSDEEIEDYVELAYELLQNPLCNTIQLPLLEKDETAYDFDILAKYVRKCVEKSIETNFNMIENIMIYSVDEPWMYSNGFDRVKLTAAGFRAMIEELSTEIENDASITSPIKSEIVASIRNMPNLVTQHYDTKYVPYIDIWCPQISYYHTEAQRNNYADVREKWWYTCCDPQIPYVTYHTEDTLLSARLESWMKVQYGIVGNLFWATNVYASYNGSVYVDIENYYDGNALRFTRQNGDGYLFYPGKMYGVDGPIGSLRLEAIRDGLEEYELAYALKNNYSNVSEIISAENSGLAFSFEDTIASLVVSLYSGTKVNATTASFDSARESLYALAEINANTGICIMDYNDNRFFIVADKDLTIKQDGKVVNAKASAAGYKMYVITASDANSLSFTVVKDGVEYEYSRFLYASKDTDFTFDNVNPTINRAEINPVEVEGSKVTLSDFEVFEPDFQLIRLMNRFGAINVNDNPEYVKSGKISAKLQPLGDPSTAKNPFIYIPLSSTRFGYSYANLNEWDNVSFWIYNAEDSTKTIEVGIVTEYNSISSVVQFGGQSYELNPGWNEIKYVPDVKEINLEFDAGNVYGIYLQFDKMGSRELDDAPVFYLDDVVITKRTIIFGKTVKGYVGEEYTLPDITVSDTSVDETTINVKVYLLNDEEKIEINVQDGKFIPEVEGTYLIEVTAKDSENNEVSATAKIQVKKRNTNPNRVLDFDDEEDNGKAFATSNNVWASIVDSFEGESGVLKVTYTQNWPSISFYPEQSMSAYADYDYLVVRAYFVSGANQTKYMVLGNDGNKFYPVGYDATLEYDKWVDYKFQIKPFLAHWKDGSLNTNIARLWMESAQNGVGGAFYIADIWVEKCEHSLSLVEERAATCLATGTKAHYSCSTCGQLFSDAEGATKIDTPEVIPAGGHSYDDNKTCSVCGHVSTDKLSVVTIDDSSDTSKIFATANKVSVSYVESYEGETGVVKVSYTHDWPSISFKPELTMSEYAEYNYIIVRAYFCNDSNPTKYMALGNATPVSRPEGYNSSVAYGQWVDYKFDITPFLTHWTDGTLNTNIARLWMEATNTQSGTFYIAGIWVE